MHPQDITLRKKLRRRNESIKSRDVADNKTEDTKTLPKAHANTYRNTASVRPSYVLVVSPI